ncbi:hypothetical protein SAMN05421690_10647 [Nitrosomonas sp. Nm51]|nr:hypothetical protein SAMN05421690_10647 [Nitrosomonas sp. Nm51]
MLIHFVRRAVFIPFKINNLIYLALFYPGAKLFYESSSEGAVMRYVQFCLSKALEHSYGYILHVHNCT